MNNDNRPVRITVCADDYGMSGGINRAIRELIASGSLNATSVMMPGGALDRTEVEALKACVAASPRCDIGLHITLTAPFRPLTPFQSLRNGMFLPLGEMMRLSLLRRLDTTVIRKEIDAQLAAFVAAFGRIPDFVDGHQHVQLFPQIRDAFLLAVRHAAPDVWVRQCGRRKGSRARNPKALVLDILSANFRRRARRLGLRTNPAFAGAYDWARATDFASFVPGFLDGLPERGVMMCHPGHVDDALRQLDGLTDQREREYSYLASRAFGELLAARNLTLS